MHGGELEDESVGAVLSALFKSDLPELHRVNGRLCRFGLCDGGSEPPGKSPRLLAEEAEAEEELAIFGLNSGMDYATARARLIAFGWQPVERVGISGFPEMDCGTMYCSGEFASGSARLRLWDPPTCFEVTEAEPPAAKLPAATFPAVVQEFIDMNELKQAAFAASFRGTVLSGSGRVFDVEECGLIDDSQTWGRECVKVVLDSGVPRVVLYYSSADAATVAEYSKRQIISFSDCVAISIKNWGAWSTATCDMP